MIKKMKNNKKATLLILLVSIATGSVMLFQSCGGAGAAVSLQLKVNN